jgi:hypothetical protein
MRQLSYNLEYSVSKNSIALLLLFCWLGLAGPAFAQDEQPEAETPAETTETTEMKESQEETDQKWQFRITPISWAFNQDLTLSGPDRTASSTVKAKDVIGDIQFTIGGRFEARKGKWGAMIDGNFIRLEDTTNVALANNPGRPLFSVTPDIRNSILQGVGTYRVVDKDDAYMDVLAGFRYYDLDVKLGVAPLVPSALFPAPLQLERDLNFIDPIIGAQGSMPLGKDVSAFLYGDIGGFGVGSDFTYRFDAGVDWAFAKQWSAQLGYRVLGVDYTTGSGTNRYELNSTQYGPTLGISLHL